MLHKWLVGIALGKVVKRVIQLVVSWLMAQQLERVGVKIDENQLTVASYAGIELLRNFLKVRFNFNFL